MEEPPAKKTPGKYKVSSCRKLIPSFYYKLYFFFKGADLWLTKFEYFFFCFNFVLFNYCVIYSCIIISMC